MPFGASFCYYKNMETKDLDIVYFIKDGVRNEEFRYSLRSVCKNMPHGRIWVFGGCPKSIVPDIRVRVKQEGKTKWDKVHAMFKLACENKELSDNFILFNDDFFVMKPVDKIETIHRGLMEEHVKVLGKSPYATMLTGIGEELKRRKLTTYSYELHTPFIFNKKKLLKLLNDNPDLRCTRTMYGNTYKIGGKRASDVKIFSSKPSFDYKSTTFLSTDDPVINTNNEAWRWIKKQFPHTCEYEIFV